MNNQKNYNLRVDENSYRKLKYVADYNHRSVNSHIEFLIEQCIFEFEKQNGKINIEGE